MVTGLEELRDYVQEILDELCSPRSSSGAQTRALERLERQIAVSCLTAAKNEELKESWDHFLALQYTFECNVPSRLLTWISLSMAKLEQAAKGSLDEPTLTSQLSRALCIIQGIVLSHTPSKEFLSRKYSLEVLLELLLASRHLTSSHEEARSNSPRVKQPTSVPLTSTALDTLLCILVDSPSALRTFESAHGVQAVVRILKRAGTPREVRMKCLEFLYFYLLDETSPPEVELDPRTPPTSPTSSAASNAVSYPGTPSLQLARARLPKPSLNTTPLRPLSRHGSNSSVLSNSSSSSRSTSNSSSQSFTSISSLSTPASSIPSSPDKSVRSQHLPSNLKLSLQTPQSPFKVPNFQRQRNPMMMLKKEVDYEPLSPRKPGIGDRLSTPSRPRAYTHGHYTPSRSSTHSSKLSICVGENDFPGDGDEKRKTTDEKKQFLGTMLGNVDALVEGVRKAGIWGLG